MNIVKEMHHVTVNIVVFSILQTLLDSFNCGIRNLCDLRLIANA